MPNTYSPVIGLEIHVELKTKSKMFCQCRADYFGMEPNTNVCPVCLGMPGALPVPNRTAIEWTMRLGKALGCTINTHTKFDRKHYFYPDLPKGYQISQLDQPVATRGAVTVHVIDQITKQLTEKRFELTRVHLEEDTGKLTHSGQDTLVDFNRSGLPLVEIVTEPCFHNSDDVKAFLEELHTIIRYLDVSDADMEKGTMRMEPNISLMKIVDGVKPTTLPAYKVEVKNINSFNFAKRAIEYELKRQQELLEKGELPAQETRGYNEQKGITYSQRSKENAHDYRYFPEPDIPPFEFNSKMIDDIVLHIPLLPSTQVEKLVQELHIRPIDAFILTRDHEMVAYFYAVYEEMKKQTSNESLIELPQRIVNLILNKKIDTNLVPSEFAAKMRSMTSTQNADPKELANAVEKVISSHEKAVSEYKSGKKTVIMFLVGQVMREMKGKADAQSVKAALESAIE